MSILPDALKYLQAGYCVIPINPYSKKPFFAWEEFQARLSTEQELRRWWKDFPTAMIGIITGSLTSLFVLDLDADHDPKVHDYIPEITVTPTSKTPRNGVHLYFKAPDDKRVTVRSDLFFKVDFRCNGGYIVAPPSRNAYGKEYRWQEGLDIWSVPLCETPVALYNYILNNASMVYKGNVTNVTNGNNIENLFSEGKRNQTVFHLAYSLARGKAEEEVLLQAINIIGQNCNPPMGSDEIKTIIESAFKRAKGRERNISEEIRQWVEVTNGVFSVTSGNNELQLVTKDEKNASKMVFSRLCKEGIIERYGDKSGVYRRVENNCEEIDFINVDEKVIDLCWPFEIERWVKILPKNIIIIAGESNAGKTAFLLSLCFQNFGKMPINFYSSEMGAMELRDRLRKFDIKLSKWKEYVNFKERSSNFSDVIKPDDLNIVDFLEITDEFYKVAGLIKEIYDKLNKGIAVIALQKPKGRDLGLGGERSIEKARLYLAIESGKIKIIKGKNWANPEVNPNGMEFKFKLIQGARFLKVDEPKTDWREK